MSDSHDEIGERLLDAALEHVPFDGWSDTTFRAAIADCAVAPALARALYPRGAVDLALAFHARGDAAMVKRLNETGLDSLRLRDKIAAAVRYRLEAVPDRELVRRGTTLFSLPQHATDGARAGRQVEGRAPLGDEEAARHRRGVGILLYLAAGR